MGDSVKQWNQVVLSEVAINSTKVSQDPEAEGFERYIIGEHIPGDRDVVKTWGSVGDSGFGPRIRTIFQPGDIICTTRGPNLKVVRVEFKGLCAHTNFVLRTADPDVLAQRYLEAVVRSKRFQQHLARNFRGSVNLFVNWSDAAKFEFALPPLEEQRRITAALWAAEATANGLLQCAEAAESVVSAAGVDLLELRGLSPFGNATERILPIGWAWVDGVSVFTAMSGNGEPLSDPHGDALFLKVADFNRNESELQLVTAETRFQAAANPGTRLFKPGTVIFPKRGASIFLNKAGVLRAGAAVDPNLMALVPREDRIDPEFLYWCVKCTGLWRFADTTSVPQLYHKHLTPMRIPLPPLMQQRHIAMRLSAMRSVQSEAKKRLALLRSVVDQIVATAFAGPDQ